MLQVLIGQFLVVTLVLATLVLLLVSRRTFNHKKMPSYDSSAGCS